VCVYVFIDDIKRNSKHSVERFFEEREKRVGGQERHAAFPSQNKKPLVSGKGYKRIHGCDMKNRICCIPNLSIACNHIEAKQLIAIISILLSRKSN